ncbi:hypothetical protein D9Q98_008535 [Chlorella vulgaris]|uniref:Uncharacterized protein n=1 Tax=Chlorella vulgaris TaxID=3077 RepID=A0A9D4TI74_CHLVU|nr:hypothetical protein D9Q98_008535 [Chlorella vulgaris]
MTSLFRRDRHPHEVPSDSPDLAFVMSFVTSVGGMSAYWMRRSALGLVSGLTVGATFALSGWWIQTSNADKHEMAHQMALMASVLFGGAMGYRAGSNPYVGPGGTMLAALGGVSSAYHLRKMLEWRTYEQSRVHEAERLLRDYIVKHPDAAQAGGPAGPTTGLPHGRMPADMRGGSGAGPGQAPGAQAGPPPLNRRSPVPPGGF